MHDPEQFAAWEATFGVELDPIDRPGTRGGGHRAPAPRADLTIDNDDLNYDAWMQHLATTVDDDDRAFDAWVAFIDELDTDIAAADAYASFIQARPARTEPVTQDGMYKMADGTIVKVQYAVNGSGRLYAKRLVVDGDHGTFEYEPGLIGRLAPTDRMTVEEAAAFGRLYGFCVVCGRTLTDEVSIATGIGPVCAGRMTN